MNHSGPNPQPSFLLSLTLSLNLVTPLLHPHPLPSTYPIFHRNPLQGQTLSIKGTLGKKEEMH